MVVDEKAEAVPIPFTKIKRSEKNKRLNDAMRIICTNTDREHINYTLGKNETNELYHSWLDISLFPCSVSGRS